MNLRVQAEKDLAVTLEDAVMGFGWEMVVTDPDGFTADLCGQSGDIALLIDPETGQAVSGRVAHVAIRISTLAEKGLGIPRGVADETEKPWVISFKDLACDDYTFKVEEARPDRTLGMVLCVIGVYVP
jgi:hypothetical protein